MGGGGYDDGTVAAPGYRALRNTEARGRRGPDYLYIKKVMDGWDGAKPDAAVSMPLSPGNFPMYSSNWAGD